MSKRRLRKGVHYTNLSTFNVRNFSLKIFLNTYNNHKIHLVNTLAFLKQPLQEINRPQACYMFTAQGIELGLKFSYDELIVLPIQLPKRFFF